LLKRCVQKDWPATWLCWSDLILVVVGAPTDGLIWDPKLTRDLGTWPASVISESVDFGSLLIREMALRSLDERHDE
jgi:hypothetical protein